MRVAGIIPARLAATRLPNKPLLDICGKPMIQHVWERCSRAAQLDAVYVATPDDAIRLAVESFGGKAIMTAHEHRTGTDRLAEAAGHLDAEIIVNIQGDEPMIDSAAIDRVVEPMLADSSVAMASVMVTCPDEELDNPATVKVVCDLSGYALYFSRSRIPFPRNQAGHVWQHLGLYAYRRDLLLRYPSLPPTPLEQTESLEQLRAMEHGYRIRMVETDRAPRSVDTQEDLERVRALMSAEPAG